MTGRARWSAAVALIGAAIGLFVQNDIPIGVFHDDGQYLILARSLAEHGTYRFDNLPGTPPGVHYPPGYPAFLALVWLVAPGNVAVFKLANAVLLGAVAAAVLAFASRVFALTDRGSAAVALAVVASAPFIWLNSLLVSETLFAALVYTTFAVDAAAGARDRLGTHVATGALAGATALVRSLGDPIGPVLVVSRLVQRRWRDALAVAVPWMVIVVPWKVWLRTVSSTLPAPLTGAYGEYSAWWREAIDAHGPVFVWDTIVKNVSQLPVTWSIFGWESVPLLQGAMALAFAGIAAAGLWHVRRAAAPVLVFAALYAGAVFAWPYEPDRFLWMLAPVVIGGFGVWVGREVREAREAREARVGGGGLGGGTWVRGGVGGVFAILLGIGVVTTHVAAYRDQPWRDGLGDRGAAGVAAARLVAGLPDGARVATDFDELVHLETGRRAVPALGLTAAQYVRPQSDSLAAMHLALVLDAFAITHVAVADVPTLRAVQWLNARATRLVAIASDTAGAALFARVAPGASPPVASAPDSTSADR